ncbi:MAG: iron-containing alcohol dehydrogenase family protein [Limnochordia bacterium]
MWYHSFIPKLQVGEDALATLDKLVRPLGPVAALVAGRHTISNGIADQVRKNLQEAGIAAMIIEGPGGEPTLSECARGLAQARAASCSSLIAIGGGSVLDMGKCIAGLFHHTADPESVVEEALYRGPRDVQALPWIAVPTTAGTGSEATHVSVLSDPVRGLKQSMRCERWYAQAVLIDPKLYVTAPPHVTAASGMDALTQAIESHVSLGATPVTQALSRQATSLLSESLMTVYRNGRDLTARRNTAVGSYLAGVALTNARLGLVHGLAHPVGIRYGIPHGRACAILLPHVMRFNLAVARQGYAELAAAIGLADRDDPRAAESLIDFIEQLNEKMEIPANLRDAGMIPEHITELAAAALPSGSTRANPRSVSQSDAESLLTELL